MARRVIESKSISVDTPLYEQAVRWLSENGLDPEEIPMDSEIVVDEETITYDKFPRDENGAYRIDKGRDAMVRETVTVSKKSSPESHGL